MPCETPPSRVKKPWRTPSSASSSPWVRTGGRMRSALTATLAGRSIDSFSFAARMFTEYGQGKARLRDRHRLEKIAHRFEPGEPSRRLGDGRRRCLVLAAGEPLRPLDQTQPAEELALRQQRSGPGAGGLRRAAERPEVDMRRQVGFAGMGEEVVISVLPYRLQRVARRRSLVAVVDDERRAALRGNARRQRLHDRLRRGRRFDDSSTNVQCSSKCPLLVI